MAYFIETHDPGEWETDAVQTLYMKEWDADRFAAWLHVIFGDDAEPVLPPDTKFFTWSPLGDEMSVQIFTV
jgi:hypothetical protein